MPQDPGLRGKVRAMLPDLTQHLVSLMAVPSVSVRGYPAMSRGPLIEAHDLVARLFATPVGVTEPIELADTAPVVIGEIPAPPGAPTVLLYSHYDVVPAGDESLWDTPPFEPTVRDGAMYGRGAADTKSNIVALVGALRAWDGRPPVGVKVVIEGQEEVGGGALHDVPAAGSRAFAADAMIIARHGQRAARACRRCTVALRGMANVTVEVRTLASAKHSGQYGGAAPDALLALHPRALDAARRATATSP